MFKVLYYADIYMPVITLAVAVDLWKYVKKTELIIFVYCLFNTALFGAADILSISGIHNMPFYHINSLAELWIVSFYLLKKITGRNFSAGYWIICIVYTCFFIFNVLFWENWTVFNSNSAGLCSLIILFLCMNFLLKLSKSDEIMYFQRSPAFWIVSGFLIYNALSILVLLSYKYFEYINMPKEADQLWIVVSVGIIVKFSLIITGLLCYRKRQVTNLPFLI